MRLVYLALMVMVIAVFSPSKILAAENEFITIVNPVRVSEFKDRDVISSITAQYKELSRRQLPATWLLTYDVLKTPKLLGFSKTLDASQEVGIWMEVTPKLAEDSGVKYNQTDSWHRSTSVFLSGYTQEERLRMIDKVFGEFKVLFGEYPKSVGAWWIDGYSLEYLQREYGVIANLGVADQHSTDGYHLWGQYWGLPFYPSKLHPASPAQRVENKLDLVNLQWAPRDPLHGYGESKASLYSTQDWFVINLPETYLVRLIHLYGKANGNQYGQITLGLEGDFPAQTYTGVYAREMEIIKELVTRGEFQATNMKQFATWYRTKFPETSPAHLILSADLIGKNFDSLWYQSPNYRIGLKYDRQKKIVSVVDLRIYSDDFRDPYFQQPNKDLDLYINLPAAFDSADNPLEHWEIKEAEFELTRSESQAKVNLGSGRAFEFSPARFATVGDIGVPPQIKNYPLEVGQSWPYPKDGLTFQALTLEAEYQLRSKKLQLAVVVALILLIALMVRTLVSQKSRVKKLVIVCLLLACVSPAVVWYLNHSESFYISPDELVALMRLNSLPDGLVVVADKNCLQCSWHTPTRPAALANRREYVSRLAKKPITYNSEIFTAKSRPEGKEKLVKTGAKYVYTARYGEYREELPFSPGDYNLELIFENANAQIWMVKN